LITGFEAADFRCLRKVKLRLTPLHALIGPNDSGKTTILQAIRILSNWVGRGAMSGPVPGNIEKFRLRATFPNRWEYEIDEGPVRSERIVLPGPPKGERDASSLKLGQGPLGEVSEWQNGVVQNLRRVELVRFDPDALRQPGHLIPLGNPVTLGERGLGLASIYDAMRDRSIESFSRISAQLRQLFPSVKELRLRAVTTDAKVLAVELIDGTEVRADAMSEGLLYFLAFAALRELDPPSMFLVEEPENGLHPARVADVVRMLRQLAEDKERPVQVLMATHSPLVINELKAEEVSVVTRPADGTNVTRMADTPQFAERSKVYNLGELWLSYSNGVNEAPLLKGVDANPDLG